MSGDGRLPVRLAAITQANWLACIDLRLSAAQAEHLASNLYSLAEAYVQPHCVPRAIYAGNVMIGFVMTEFMEASAAYNVPRFMIDQDWQGRGYGGAALDAVIAVLRDERADAPIFISLTAGNEPARRLYLRHGFVATGQRVHGEEVLRHP